MKQHFHVPMRTVFLTIACVLLAACGGGSVGDSGSKAPQEEPPKTSPQASAPDTAYVPPQTKPPIAIIAIGNSITVHSPNASLGWNGTWGMAASSESMDYAGQFSALVSLSSKGGTTLKRFNISHLEEDALTPIPQHVISSAVAADIVIVELGDNVEPSGLVDFQVRYRDLLRLIHSTKALVFCTSTYWPRPALSDAIESICHEAGGNFVDISSISGSSGVNASYLTSASDGVKKHPGDIGMKRIAEALHSHLIKTPGYARLTEQE